MTNKAWAKPGVGGLWSTSTNWSPAAVPGSADVVTLGAGASGYTVTMDVSPTIASLTLNGAAGHITEFNVASHSLIVTGKITLNANTELFGAGAVTAGASISGAGTIDASGGALVLNGSVASGVVLAIDNTTPGSELLINGAAVSSRAIAMSNANQTLAIGSSGQLNIVPAETLTGGTLQLEGGKLTDSAGLNLGAGANLTGLGTVSTGSAHLNGGGTVTALGGALTFGSAVDTTGTAGNFDVGHNGDLVFNGAVGASAITPPVTFVDGTGTLNTIGVTIGNLHLGTITNFQAGDTFDLRGYGANDKFTLNTSHQTITITNAVGSHSETFQLKDTTGSYGAGSITMTQSLVGSTYVDALTTTQTICFMAGTLIRTPDGETPVETLKRGDLVMTTDGVARPVSWLGKQTVSAMFADPARSWPIRVKAGALGENVPARDLLLSPDHALLVDGVLIHAGALVNGTSVARETTVPRVFVYYHVELDDHSLILAEDAPAETFVDNVDRLNFDNWAEHQALYPDGKPIKELPYPRAKARRQVPVDIRVALAERAQIIGAVEEASAA